MTMHNATWQLAYLFRKAKTAHASGPVLCARARKRSMTPQPISHGNMPALRDAKDHHEHLRAIIEEPQVGQQQQVGEVTEVQQKQVPLSASIKEVPYADQQREFHRVEVWQKPGVA